MLLTPEQLLSLADKPSEELLCNNVANAFVFAGKLATEHYENFPVGSLLIPKDKRNSIFAVYAFARLADDIADELTQIPLEIRLSALQNMARNLSLSNDAILELQNPVFIALRRTMLDEKLPAEPFLKLLEAFRRDILFAQPQSYDDLTDYCSYSANPVGEIVLRIFGLYSAETAPLSDAICTGLQLVNFWQDLSVDLPNGRCYLPQEILNLYSLSNQNLHLENKSVKLSQCINELFDFTEKYFQKGAGLIGYLKPLRLRLEIAASLEGGTALLKKLRYIGADVFAFRAKLRKTEKFMILWRAFNSIF